VFNEKYMQEAQLTMTLKHGPRKAYMYLGIEESCDIQHKKGTEKLEKEYLRTLKLYLRTE